MPISITQQVNQQLAFAKALYRQLESLDASPNYDVNRLVAQAILQGGVGAVYRGLCLYLEELQQRLKEQGVLVKLPLMAKRDWLDFSKCLVDLINSTTTPEFSELAVLAESNDSWLYAVVHTYLSREDDDTHALNTEKAGVGIVETIKLVDVEKTSAKIDTAKYLESVIASFEELLQRHREAMQYC